MHLLSNWQIGIYNGATWVPVVQFGGRLQEEVKWSLRKPLEVVPLAGTQAPFLRDLKNSVIGVRISVIERFATDTEARQHMLFYLAAWKAVGKTMATFQDAGMAPLGLGYVSLNAYLETYDPVIDVTPQFAQITKTYNLTCADLAAW